MHQFRNILVLRSLESPLLCVERSVPPGTDNDIWRPCLPGAGSRRVGRVAITCGEVEVPAPCRK